MCVIYRYIIYSRNMYIQFTNTCTHHHLLGQSRPGTSGTWAASQRAQLCAAEPRSARFFLHDCSGGGVTPPEAPGTYPCFPDNNEASWPLPSLTPFSSELFREHSMFSQLKERAWRGGGFAPERAHCAGTNYSPLQRSWGGRCSTASAGWRREGAVQRVGRHLDPSH